MSAGLHTPSMGTGMFLQRRRVSECATQIAVDVCLGREVQFLEELGRDGDAARGLDLLERSLGVVRDVQMLVVAIAEGACDLAVSKRRTVQRRCGLLPLLKSFSSTGEVMSGVGAVRFSLFIVRS